MARAEIWSICFGGFPGTNRLLREISRATERTRHLVVSSGDIGSPEIAFLRHHLAGESPRAVILGSWHPIYEPLIDAARDTGAEIAILWTSSAVQTDIGGETAALVRLLDDRRIARFFASGEEMARLLAASGRPSHVLPAPLSIGPRQRRVERADSPTPIVSFFCSPNELRRKNALASVVALASLDVPYLLHANGLAGCAEYRLLLERMRVPYRDLAWMDEDGYARALDAIDVGLQVSLAEGFDYVVAEHFARATPVVVSASVPCAHGLPREIASLLVVANSDSPEEIRSRLRRLLADPEARRAAGRAVREHIESLAARHADEARRGLAEAFGAS